MILRTINQQSYTQGFRTLGSDNLPAGLNRLRFGLNNVDWTDSMFVVLAYSVSYDNGATWIGPNVITFRGDWRNPGTGLRERQWGDIPLLSTSTVNTSIRSWLVIADPANPAQSFASDVVIEGFA